MYFLPFTSAIAFFTSSFVDFKAVILSIFAVFFRSSSPNIDANVSVGGQDFSLTYEKPTTGATGNFFQKYKMPLIIGGVAVALVGGFLLLKKKR